MNIEKQGAIKSLKTAKGQIDGVIKMIDDGRYCVDISNQLLAVGALVKKSQNLILKQHIRHCVTEAVVKGEQDKLDEIMTLIEKL